MSASKSAAVRTTSEEASSELPPHFYMTADGVAWRPEVLAGMRALRIPDASLEMFTAPEAPVSNVCWLSDARFREGEWRKVRLRGGAIEMIAVTKLCHGYYTDGQRHALFKASQDETEEEGKRKPLREVERPHGMPRLLAAWRPEGPSERKATEESWLRLDWSTLSELGPIETTEAQLLNGECWALFQGIAISSKRDVSLYADLVKAQLDTFNVPRGLAPRFTGFNQSPSGKWRYYLPDGRAIGEAKPDSTHDLYPIDGGRLLAGERADAWEAFELPRKAITHNDLVWLTRFFNEVDETGRLLLLTCASARSLVCSIAHCGTSVMLLGDSGAGKTISANFVRGIIGPSPLEVPADSKFHNATKTSIEIAIAPVRDAPVIIDDFHPSEADTESDRKAMEQVIDAVITASADGMEIRQRATREARKRSGVHVRSLVIMTGESYDGGIRSRLRRTICLEYKEDEVETDALISGWNDYQTGLTVAGHALIRNILERLNTSESETRQEIRERDKANTESLFRRLTAKRPRAENQIVRSIAQRYAAAATGADMLDQACSGQHDRPMANALSLVIESLALAQIDRIASGGLSSIDREWIVSSIRSIFGSRGGHLLRMNGTPFTAGSMPNADEKLPDLGYGRISGSWEPFGICLGNLSDESDVAFFRPNDLQDKLRHRAMTERLQWKWNPQTFPAAMAALGLAECGNDGRPTKVVWINNQSKRRIAMPWDYVHPQSNEEADEPLPAMPDEYQSVKPLVGEALAFPAAPTPASRPASPHTEASSPIIHPADWPAPPGKAAAPVVPNPRFLSTEPIAVLPPQTVKAFDPLAPPRRVSKSQARKAEEARTQAASPIPRPEVPPSVNDAPRAPIEAPGAAVPAPPRAPAEAPGKNRWPERIAAVDPETLYLLAPDGSIERRPLAPELRPEKACAGRLAGLIVPERITQLWLHPSYTAETDLPGNISVTAARNGIECGFASHIGTPHGWNTPDKIKAWTRLINGRQEASIVVASLDNETRFRNAADASTMLTALNAFHATSGFWYRVDPAITFEAMLRSLHRNGLDLKADISPTEFPDPMRSEIVTELVWTRALTDHEKASGKFVHAFDKRGMYLATMSSLAVGFGKPEYAPEPYFDPRKAGYWQARINMPDTYQLHRLPDPGSTRPRQNAHSMNWHVTPTLALALQLGAKIEVNEAWLFNETHQPFAPVYRRLRDARRQLTDSKEPAADLALSALKSLYTKGVGNLASHKKRDAEEAIDLYRPDWRHFIVATARANVLRNLIKAGLEPFAIRTDAIYVIADSDDPAVAAASLRLGQELGQWDHIGSMPFAELPTEFLDGSAVKTPQRYLDKLTALMKQSDGS